MKEKVQKLIKLRSKKWLSEIFKISIYKLNKKIESDNWEVDEKAFVKLIFKD